MKLLDGFDIKFTAYINPLYDFIYDKNELARNIMEFKLED